MGDSRVQGWPLAKAEAATSPHPVLPKHMMQQG
jgi:hypothetical protein